ncbi:MAG: hypothetical protein AAB769_01605 [Patescibacteria group bacterium]
MTENVAVAKNPNENTTSLIRRFTKRVQGAGILRRVRSLRYSERSLSKFTHKKRALKRMKKRTEFERLLKLGRVEEKPVRTRKG